MEWEYLTCCRIRQQFRLIAAPVNIHPLFKDPFNGRRYRILSPIFSREISVELIEL